MWALRAFISSIKRKQRNSPDEVQNEVTPSPSPSMPNPTQQSGGAGGKVAKSGLTPPLDGESAQYITYMGRKSAFDHCIADNQGR
jgi:hypothetical protein